MDLVFKPSKMRGSGREEGRQQQRKKQQTK